MAYVKDVMKRGVVTVKKYDSVTSVSRLLAKNKISNVPVLNKKSELVGLVSEQDIIRAMASKNFMKMKAKDIMTKQVLSVKENDSLEYVAKIFMEYPFRRIPVTRRKKVIGSITREGLINTFMSDYY